MDPTLGFGAYSISAMLLFNLVLYILIRISKGSIFIYLQSIESFDQQNYFKNYELIKSFGANTIDAHYKVIVHIIFLEYV